ncbi:MAG TPA: hypothetical protein VFI91_03040 [Longimicrobiaceae bacterium]|nr:hypothetical protein [Longimicrobiaceae bacterium]
MADKTATPGLAQAQVELRRARILDALDRPAERAGSSAAPLSADRCEHLRSEAEDLYWNEISWEELMDEEAVGGGHLTELVFPGFLAYVDGLLVERVPDDALAPAQPHPDAVEEILTFLGEQYADLTMKIEAGADSERLVWNRAMSSALIDLVLYRLYRVTPSEREEIERVD